MSPFITFRDTDNDGILQYYILQRNFPHFVGIISLSPVVNVFQPFPIAGYNIWVTFAGTIMGRYIPSYNHISEEIAETLANMAAWFYDQRIRSDEKKYSKWKINT